MTYTFKMARRLATCYAAPLLFLLAQLSCGEPQIAGSSPPPDTTAVALRVTPGLDTTLVAQPVQLRAQALNAEGDPVPSPVDWTATGGSVDTTGRFIATSAGTFVVRARHRHRPTVGDSGTVVVVPPPPTLTRVLLTPATALLQPGASQPFTVSGQWSDGSTTAPAVTFAATGGSITTAGVYTAGSTAGAFRVIATQQGGTLADTSTITIATPPATLTSLTLAPASVTLTTGTTRQFSVSGQWSDGSTTAPAVTYAATGGTITAAGLYTAGTTAGSFRVIATQQGGTLADTSAVTITAPTLAQVILAPATASLATGGTQQFSVSGRMSDGSTSTVTVTYSATGGTISTGGLYTAGATAGSFRVIATQQGGTLADTSAVTLTAPAPTLVQVILAPATASLATGGTQQFTVSGRMSDNSTTTPAVTYVATGGTISTGGLYTAGATAGSFRVIATQQGGTLADTSAVTLTAAPPPTLVQVILSPPAPSVVTGGTLQFSVSGRMSDNSTTTPAVTYVATGGTISTGGLYTAGTATGGFRVIATQQGGTLADTSAVTVSPTTSGPGAVFYADWGTALGTSTAALTDGGRWDDAIGPHNNIAVVDATAAPGAPTAHIYRVTNSVSDLGYNWVEKANLWVNPQVGETRYWRMYLYNSTADSQGSLGPEASYHPLEFASPVYNGMEQWNLIFSTNSNGTFPFKFAPLAASFPKNRWIPTNGPGVQANPKKFTWYRIEWSLTKTAPSVFTMHARISERNPATGVETVVWDDNSIRDASLNLTLAASGTGITGVADAAAGQIRVGTNGGSVWFGLTSDQYVYWAGMCVRSDTWCGPYVAGEH
jgi:hypothetical protein